MVLAFSVFFSILWEDLVYLAALTFPQFYSRNKFRVCFFPTLKQNKILFSVHYFALIGKKPVNFFFQNKQSKNQKSMYIDENVSYTWCKPLVGTIVRVSCAFIVSFSLVLEREYALFFFVDSFSIYVVGFAYTRGCWSCWWCNYFKERKHFTGVILKISATKM